MDIDIKKNMRITDIKTQFHAYFHYLKIEFFKGKHDKDSGSPRDMMLGNDTPMKDLLKDGKEGSVNFSEHTTVKEFEQKFMDKFNLNMQVFRKSGTIYLETTSTDSWTLEQQNREAELASTPGKIEPTKDQLDRDQWG